MRVLYMRVLYIPFSVCKHTVNSHFFFIYCCQTNITKRPSITIKETVVHKKDTLLKTPITVKKILLGENWVQSSMILVKTPERWVWIREVLFPWAWCQICVFLLGQRSFYLLFVHFFGFCLIWFLYSKLIFRVQHKDRQQLWDNWKLNTCRVSLSKKAEYVSDYVRGMLKKPLVLLHVTIFFQTSKLSLLSLFFLIIFHVNSWHRSFL